MVERAAYTDSDALMDQANQTLVDYYKVNGRLPCVASMTTSPGTTGFGVELGATGTTCYGGVAAAGGTWRVAVSGGYVRIGMLPVRTLGLADTAASDKFGGRILYAVTEALTDSGAFGANAGKVTINDMNGNAIATDAAYFLDSMGKDSKGAYRYKTGSVTTACGASANLDVLNCSFGSTFRDAPFNNGSQAAKFFDDLPRWMPKYRLTAAESSSSALWAANGTNIYSVGTDADTTTGYVGIGNTTPQQILHISGPAGSAVSSWNGSGGNRTGLQVGDVDTGIGPLFLIHNDPNIAGNMYYNNGWRYAGGTGKPATIDLAANGINFFTSNNAVGAAGTLVADLSPSGVARMTITPAGLVGIGTTAPGALTDIYDGIGHISFGNAQSLPSGYNLYSWANSTGGHIQSVNIGTSWTNLILNENGGNVGIGTSNPLQKLEVDGTVQIGTYTPIGSTGPALLFGPTGDNTDTLAIYRYNMAADKTELRMVIADNGNDGTELSDAFHVLTDNGVSLLYVRSNNGFVGIGTASPSYRLDVQGSIRGYGITDSSDETLKRDIKPLSSAEQFDKLLKLRGTTYYWKDKQQSQRQQIGLIAQEMEKLFPELVETDKQGIKSINYSHLIVPAIAAIQELKKKDDALDTRVKALETAPTLDGGKAPSTKQKPGALASDIAALKAENAELKLRVEELEATTNPDWQAFGRNRMVTAVVILLAICTLQMLLWAMLARRVQRGS